ncbi:TPA: hypothetical protein EYP26_03090 [Candidatus Bathyarchaeota archaeon]|nr:hypothetical protein [Candidatus Bathyarchaeota archaeon]
MSRLGRKPIHRRDFLKLTLLSALASLSLVKGAKANLPDVEIRNISQGSMGKIRIEVRHENPSSSHYVDAIEIDVDGQIVQFNPCACKQNKDVFTVDVPLGGLEGSPSVKVRGHCTVHGWGPWSNQIQIPEFAEAAVALAALAASLFMARGALRALRGAE